MLTHPGSKPGPSWMRRHISESMADPERIHEVTSQLGRWHWAGVAALAAVAIGWRAFARLAMGNAALAVGALGNCAYAGTGIAYGSHEARGRQKEQLIG